MKNIGDHLYVAALLPYDRQMKIDELAYRQFLQHFLKNEKFVRMGGGLCINPEAGEIFYLTRAEKRRALEIAMEEINGKVPVIAGTWALTTEETVETAKDCKALGVDGIFVTPPGGAQDVTSCWDADNYPEIWLDQIIAQDRAVDLPIVTHPVGGAKPPFYPGLPLGATLKICNEVKNIVGWKMTYMYDGFRLIAKGLRGLDRHVAVMGALASRFHEYKATGMFDGTLSGFWNFALDPMLDHLEAWIWVACTFATKPPLGCADSCRTHSCGRQCQNHNKLRLTRSIACCGSSDSASSTSRKPGWQPNNNIRAAVFQKTKPARPMSYHCRPPNSKCPVSTNFLIGSNCP